MLIGVCSDVGNVRDVNQDSYFYSDLKELPLFIVADGMGGHKAGEIASNFAIETVKETFYRYKDQLLKDEMEIPQFINMSFTEANERIYKKSCNNESYSGMGTTITMAFIFNDEIFIGHIGDSRAYLLRDKELIQLTQDHSLVAELVRNGSISKEEAINHPQKNIITRALGTSSDIRIDILSREVKNKDIILLCTDGLTNMISDEGIRNILINTQDIQESCNLLTKTANELGGLDNTTVMLIEIS